MLGELIFQLALPLRFAPGSTQRLEVMEQAFLHSAYARQQNESKQDVGAGGSVGWRVAWVW